MKDGGELVTKSISIGGNEFKYEITNRDILSDHVSVNAPFQRFLSGLMPSYSAFGPGKEIRNFSYTRDLSLIQV